MPRFSEQPSTYFVQDRSSIEELTRLTIQDRMITTGMGGALPELSEPPASLQHILDIGCGTGGWLIEIAKTYPGISQLTGVDVSLRMLDHARNQAQAQGVGERIEFRLMDVLARVDFPSASFDLVNQRLGDSYLRTWEWPKLLGEYRRITRPGGIIRITEGGIPQSSSPALNQLNSIFLQSLDAAGHVFPVSPGMAISDKSIHALAGQLRQQGIQRVQTQDYNLQWRAGTSDCQHFIDATQRLFRTLIPFFKKWVRLPDTYEQLYHQACIEMKRSDFVANWLLRTAWGYVPVKAS